MWSYKNCFYVQVLFCLKINIVFKPNNNMFIKFFDPEDPDRFQCPGDPDPNSINQNKFYKKLKKGKKNSILTGENIKLDKTSLQSPNAITNENLFHFSGVSFVLFIEPTSASD